MAKARDLRADEGAEVTSETLTVSADDGLELAARRWIPEESPRAVLQVAHGMAEHKDRYAGFAEFCAERGLVVYAHDHRGHGDTITAETPRGHFADYDGWRKVLGDVHTVNGAARQAFPDLPVFLFGHSMGSFLTRAYLLEHGSDLAGAIISATGWRLGIGNRVLQLAAAVQAVLTGSREPNPVMTKLVFGSFNLQFLPARTAFDWLSRDRQVVDQYIADPLCGFDCSARLWEDLLGGVYDLEQAEAQRYRIPPTPLLIITGSRDPVSMGGLGSGQLAKLYRAGRNRDVTDRRYAGGRHELLNETNHTEVWSDIVAWIDRHL